MRNKYSNEQICLAVTSSKSWAEVCRKLRGIDDKKAVLTGMQWHIKNRAKEAGCDFSHFLGQGWNRGGGATNKRPIEFYLENKGFISSHTLKKRLIAEGYRQPFCENCLGHEWHGVPMPLELHHVDGDHFNNEIGNLRILCPNCHTAFPTLGLSNKSSSRASQA